MTEPALSEFSKSDTTPSRYSRSTFLFLLLRHFDGRRRFSTTSSSFSIARFAARGHLVPATLPFLSPRERSFADNADFRRQILFLHATHHAIRRQALCNNYKCKAAQESHIVYATSAETVEKKKGRTPGTRVIKILSRIIKYVKEMSLPKG